MNHPSSGLLLLSKAIPGFIHFKTAEGLSDRTIASHEWWADTSQNVKIQHRFATRQLYLGDARQSQQGMFCPRAADGLHSYR